MISIMPHSHVISLVIYIVAQFFNDTLFHDFHFEIHYTKKFLLSLMFQLNFYYYFQRLWSAAKIRQFLYVPM